MGWRHRFAGGTNCVVGKPRSVWNGGADEQRAVLLEWTGEGRWGGRNELGLALSENREYGVTTGSTSTGFGGFRDGTGW